MLTHEYFAGKSIFITGGTGFLGKVLIEKLLRSCPDVGNIYILIREKRGKSISQRMEAMKALPLYDLVREQNSSLFDKLIPVKGDVCEINLGLSPEDRKILTENVNIIYHTAASVRFDDLLRYAILLNVRGTREVAKLALDLKNISLFVHTSTTYCNIDKKVIEEQLYRPHGDWGEAIRLAEEYDEEILKTFTEKYIQPLPNTYTYAKSLAEHVVNDMCSGKIPTLIVRPSVVISTLDEPVKGWNDNLNGPVGLLLAGGKGLMRTILGKSTAAPDYIPVDMTIKAFLVATRNYAENLPENKVEVINISQGAINRISIGEVIDMGKEVIQQSPFSTSLWYPRFEITNCWFNYFIQVLLFHMLPAVFLDIALRLSGRKPMLFTLQRKIYIANVVLSPFLSSTWIFKNDKILKIVDAIDKREEKTFGVGKLYLSKEEQIEYFKNGRIGGAIYVLKEDVDPKAAKTNLKRLWYLDITVRIIFYLFLFWLVVVKINIVKVLFNTVENYFKNL